MPKNWKRNPKEQLTDLKKTIGQAAQAAGISVTTAEKYLRRSGNSKIILEGECMSAFMLALGGQEGMQKIKRQFSGYHCD